MKIKYDHTALIAGIGLVPWTRLGPERWFENYKIATLYGWDVQNITDAPQVLALSDQVTPLPALPKLNSQQLLQTDAFQKLLVEQLPAYTFLTYKPVVMPAELKQEGITSAGVDQALTASLENKVTFRERFADLDLPIPDYTVYDRHTLKADLETLHQLLNRQSSIILQDEILSGGRGTFVIQTLEDLAYALQAIESLGGGKRVVVSERIAPMRERSVQACATRYGTFVGPLQKQIIGDPLLANLDVPDGDRFCGAEIADDDPLQSVYPTIKQHTLRIGERLIKLGYRGIFSVDCLVDEALNVYIVEINPRLTGITPLLTALYREGKDIPFYLLHVLETANMDYEIIDDFVTDEPACGSLMLVHGHNEKPSIIEQTLHSGLYEGDQYVQPAYCLDGSSRMLLQRYAPPTFPIKPGGRLLTVLSRKPVLDKNDALLPEAIKVVNYIQTHTVLKELTL